MADASQVHDVENLYGYLLEGELIDKLILISTSLQLNLKINRKL